jgi:hypothetical protein
MDLILRNARAFGLGDGLVALHSDYDSLDESG